MNKINIKGRLTKDVVVKDTAAGKVVTFTVADNMYRNGEPVKDENGKNLVQYIACAARGKAADVAETLAKGSFVDGDGYLKVDTNKVGDGDDAKYYTNVTIWINRFHEKPANAPAEA